MKKAWILAVTTFTGLFILSLQSRLIFLLRRGTLARDFNCGGFLPATAIIALVAAVAAFFISVPKQHHPRV